MRQLIYLLAAVSLTMTSCSGGDKYVITGKVEGSYDGDKVYMMNRVNREFINTDSTVIKNGEFRFEGSEATPVSRYLAWTDGENDPIYVDFFLENGKIQVNLTEDPSTTTVKGTPTNDAFQSFKNDMAAVQQKMQAIYSTLSDTSVSQEQRDAKMAEMEDTEKEMINIIKSNISKNSKSALGAMLLNNYNYYMDYDVVEGLLADVPANVLEGDEGLTKLKERVEVSKNTVVGKKFVDLEMLTPEGNPIKLSDYAGKGKIVLIDFWASWCGPCRREMPRLVEAYAKYKDKGFEIVGVSFDRDGDSWIKGIKDLNITWPQMSDLKYWESEGAKVYAIRSIPHVVLLDKDGTIVSRGLHGDELQEKIKELMD